MDFSALQSNFKGEILTDNINRIIYSTDASAYRERPLAVCVPIDNEDIRVVIRFAREKGVSIIPRASGTSIAGQVVGAGIVVDVSKNFGKILELNEQEKWVRLQPCVVLDELNKYLAPHNLFFGPETSTSNRCMISGMVGNNSCGSHSLIYGSTRDHLLEVKCILSDGSDVVFGEITKEEFLAKCELQTLEGDIYRHIRDLLSNEDVVSEIKRQYPNPEIRRRNTGYALDCLLDNEIFGNSDKKFNFCKLIAGSEGTLAFVTEVKLNLVDRPSKNKALMCVHTETLDEVFEANLVALKYSPSSVELMDKKVLDLTKENISQRRNRFFVEGDPEGVLIVEWANDDENWIQQQISALEKDLREHNYGYCYPIVRGEDIPKVWALRKAGLGVLGNMPGDRKPAPVIEDTAVRPEDLPAYMKDFREMLQRLGLECVFYAHISTGELHLRPILNLKDEHDVELFHTVALETAKLVKKYHGSLSGEHGDGRLRGEFIPLMLGDKIYDLFVGLKQVWDADNVFNSGKIINTPKMNTHLRYKPGQQTREIETLFDFSRTGGYLRTAEKCNGAGDCRKSHIIGGTLCPSFQATKNERNSTRARANILRELITNSTQKNPFMEKEAYEVLDLCLLCKACKSECPSGVDVAKLKMEFLQHYYDNYGVPLRSRAVALQPRLYSLASLVPHIANFFMSKPFFAHLMQKSIKFSTKRTLPLLSTVNLKKRVRQIGESQSANPKKTIYLFVDEFSKYLDTHIAVDAVSLFTKLGYEVKLAKAKESARTWLSKGLVRKAKKIANENIEMLGDVITENTPLIGIEPSTILAFRDEYPDLAYEQNREKSQRLAKNALLFDEFICNEMALGNITSEMFTDEAAKVLFHGHCQQKALIGTKFTKQALSLPRNFTVEEIPSGCCGMAGAFGYEKEHYDLSMKIGELVLFPAVRNAEKNTIISAVGTSCRCQIKDGTGVDALHPIELLNRVAKPLGRKRKVL